MHAPLHRHPKRPASHRVPEVIRLACTSESAPRHALRRVEAGVDGPTVARESPRLNMGLAAQATAVGSTAISITLVATAWGAAAWASLMARGLVSHTIQDGQPESKIPRDPMVRCSAPQPRDIVGPFRGSGVGVAGLEGKHKRERTSEQGSARLEHWRCHHCPSVCPGSARALAIACLSTSSWDVGGSAVGLRSP